MRVRSLLLAALIALPGCSADQSLVYRGSAPMDLSQVDGRPLDVLPSGALLVGELDAKALFQSSLGGQMGQLVANVLPLGPESNFVAQRDVERVHGGAYTMQGADFVAVLQGTFDVAAIEAAAAARSATPSGVPLVKTRYGDRDLYTVGELGFVTLTPRTILSGNDTGLRRALDRLRYGRLEGALPAWMLETLRDDQGAAFAVAGDLGGQGVVAAAGDRLPFVRGIELVRMLGNFQAPGLNVVGSLTYADEPSANAGAQSLQQLNQLAAFGSILSVLGFGGSVPQVEVKPQGSSVAFASQIDTAFASMLLGIVVQATRPGAR